MPSPAQQIVETQSLGSSAELLYVSPSQTWTQILALTAVNVDSVNHVITLYIVPAGAAANTSTISTPPRAILVGASYSGQNEIGQILNPGDALWGQADVASTVNILASGLLNTT